ncbi:MAG: SDR family oxidoreductase, partial [Deltaproteobacteria bacterium]|nr:SDR family oxidoreductase [Deltaproteobacteria bacterium]
MKLEGRYALISGASCGFGKAVAEAFVKEGASVIICARGKGSLERTREELSGHLGKGQRLLSAVADVTDRIEMDSLAATSLSEFPHLDILVNSAGVYGPMGPIENVGWEEWVNAVNINLMGTVYLCRAVIGHFKKRGYGKIVNLSGGGATKPLPYMSAYAASKAAVVRFTETLAVEVKDFGIDVNAAAPGALNTRLLDSALEAGPQKIG